ncbi:MAG: poly(3-hydroxybutyrate) depolymerase [Verrucomicrobiales bacterium]
MNNRSGWAEVELIKVIGGGHSVPGARQYLPEKIIGKTCGNAKAPELIWEFLARHPKPDRRRRANSISPVE